MAKDPIRPIHLGKGVWLNQRHQSGAPDMKSALAEQVRLMRDHLASADTTPKVWVDGGSDFDLVADKLDEMQRESLAHAWGYLKGAADMAALTVEELLGKYKLSLQWRVTLDQHAEEPTKRHSFISKHGTSPVESVSLPLGAKKEVRRRPLCPKCGGKSHRCKTGSSGCRHCNNEACGHGWQQK